MPLYTVKNQDIERLRAVAVVAVFLQHIDNLTPIAPGYALIFNHITFWTGVDLFFAVSGFVVARSLLDSFGTNVTKRQILMAFFARRFFRLIPSAWLWLAITLILYSFVIKSVPNAEPGTVLNGVVAAVMNISNVFWYYCDPTAPIAPSMCPNGNTVAVYWSLSLEEQFYVVLALAACLCPLKKLTPVFTVMIVAQFFLPRTPFSLAWLLRTDAFFLGVMICLLRRTVYAGAFDWLLSRIGRTGAIVVMAVALSAIIFAPVQIPAVGCGIAAIGSGLLVLVASSNFDLVPGGKFVAWIGSRSYAIYLIHFVVLALIREGLMRAGLFTEYTDWLTFIGLALFALATTVLVAQVNLVAVERPFRRLGYRISDRILRGKPSIRSAPIPTLRLSYRLLPSRTARRT